MKNALEGMNIRLGDAECLNDLEDRIMEITQSVEQKQQKNFFNGTLKKIFIWLHRVLVAAHRLLSCSMLAP